jgi:hypothetical protein
LMQACADAEGVIARARSLFGTGGAAEVPSGASEIAIAAQAVTMARSRTADLSGAGVASYQAMADRSVPPLRTAASSDSALAAHLSSAAAVTQAGAARLDGIAAQTKLVTQVAPLARTSADQRVILTALRSQVAAASQVVKSTQQQASALAGQVRGLKYPKESPGGGVQALDMPLAPPPFLPESPWEYHNGYTTEVTARGPDGELVDGGSLVTLDDVWNELHRCFNCNFPIGGAPKEFPKVGDQLPLEMRISGVAAASLPVKVTQITRTADAIDIEFGTLPGHADGPGSTIHFRWTEQLGAPHLDIRGYITEGPGSGDGPLSAAARVGYTGLAQLVWQPYIDNVVTHVVQAKGYEALPMRVIGGH